MACENNITLAYLQYHQIANINWNKLQSTSGDALTILTNATTQLPIVSGNGNNSLADTVMTKLGIPLTSSMTNGLCYWVYEGIVYLA